MVRIRKDINQGGAVWHDSLIWYARAVERLYLLPITDRTSWRYLAAIHGIDPDGWKLAGVLRDDDTLPPLSETEQTWEQCQHGCWYFLPWHRGYLAAFEAIVAKAVQELGGPNDWALPYWNYLNASDPASRNIPEAFLQAELPDGSPNFLAKAVRNGERRLGPTGAITRDITLKCQTDFHRFTSAPGTLAYGGGRETMFTHGGRFAGANESDPHNLVHLMVGGIDSFGFMSDTNFAALDPIFWVHHCNIDRLWAAWLTQPQNIQESSAAWSKGPVNRPLVLPDTDGQLAAFTPGETVGRGPLEPIYDDLTTGTGISLEAATAESITLEATVPASFSDKPPPQAHVLGSNAETVTVGQTASTTTVSVANPEFSTLAHRQTDMARPQRFFLNLEQIRGAAPSGVLKVTINAEGGQPHLADTVALFGLANASASDRPHGGNGLGASIDITQAAQAILAAGGSLETLTVVIEQPDASPGREITVGRVSLVAQDAE